MTMHGEQCLSRKLENDEKVVSNTKGRAIVTLQTPTPTFVEKSLNLFVGIQFFYSTALLLFVMRCVTCCFILAFLSVFACQEDVFIWLE